MVNRHHSPSELGRCHLIPDSVKTLIISQIIKMLVNLVLDLITVRKYFDSKLYPSKIFMIVRYIFRRLL